MARLDDALREIADMPRAELQDRWTRRTGRPAPRLGTEMLRLALAYELQSKAMGGLSRKARQRLDGCGGEKARGVDLRPGLRLAREHGGTMHVVTIGDAGEIVWNDRQWRSLSAIARAITGTRWSGPAFFGLRQARAAA